MSRRSKIIAIACFLIMITLPGLFINYDPSAISTYENRALTENVQFFTLDGKINMLFPSTFNQWINDRIGFRSSAYELYTHVVGDLLKTSPVSTIVFGKDGWLFSTDSNNIEIAKGIEIIDSKSLQCMEKLFASVTSMIRQNGADYCLLLTPSKTSVYPEYINSNFSQITSPIDIVSDYLTLHTDMKVINTKPSLLRAKTEYDFPLFCRTDTHWNSLGGYVAYRELIDALKKNGTITTNAVDVSFSRQMFIGDMQNMMHKDNNGRSETVPIPDLASVPGTQLEFINNGPMYDELMRYKDKNCLNAIEILKNRNAGNDLRILVMGDSFSNLVRPYLGYNCAEEIFVWNYIPDEELLRIVQPDIVITEVTERFLSVFSLYLSEYVIGDNLLRIELTCSEEYDKIYFPVWSEDCGQDDLVWYEAKRSDEDNCVWYADVDLSKHGTGTMIVHTYSKDDVTGEMTFLTNDRFNKR